MVPAYFLIFIIQVPGGVFVTVTPTLHTYFLILFVNNDVPNQCCGSGFNVVLGYGSGFAIRTWIQEGKNEPQKS
jgi:hypothetical protein